MITNGIDVIRSRKVYLWIYLCSKYTIYMGEQRAKVDTPVCKTGIARSEWVQFPPHPPYVAVAQQVEHWTENPGRVGSIPTGGTIL